LKQQVYKQFYKKSFTIEKAPIHQKVWRTGADGGKNREIALDGDVQQPDAATRSLGTAVRTRLGRALLDLVATLLSALVAEVAELGDDRATGADDVGAGDDGSVPVGGGRAGGDLVARVLLVGRLLGVELEGQPAVRLLGGLNHLQLGHRDPTVLADDHDTLDVRLGGRDRLRHHHFNLLNINFGQFGRV